MWPAAGAMQTLDGPHRLAVDLPQQGDAGIHRLATAVGAFQHDGAGAAIALGAAFLGAPEPAMLAQPVEQRRHRRQAVELHRLVVQDKTYAVRHANDCDRGVLYAQARLGYAKRLLHSPKRMMHFGCHSKSAKNGSLPVQLLPRRRTTEAFLAQRRAGRGLGLPKHRALRISSGRGAGAQSLAAHAASRRAGLWRPRLRQPRRPVAHVRGLGQAQRALHRVAVDVGDRNVSRDPGGHGGAALGVHEPRLLQHALPLGLQRAGGARGHRAQQGHAPPAHRPQAARLVLARHLQHARPRPTS